MDFVDKGNCFIVMDRADYNEKIEALLNNRYTYQLVHKSPFAKVEKKLKSRSSVSRNKIRLIIDNYWMRFL